MTKSHQSIVPILLSATLTSTFILGSSFYHSVKASPKPMEERETLRSNTLISIRFEAPPGETAPSTSIGGGVRGEVKFASPGDAAPSTTIGGGVRGEVKFASPGDAAPSTSIGGGVRSDMQFSPPGDDSPVHRISGGTRTDELLAMTALLPTTKYGRTVVGHPTFFVYLPPTSSKEVFFSMQDEQGNHHYQTILKIAGDGGVVGVTLPDEAPELKVGTNYMWFFAPIEPDGILKPDNAGVIGWVKRVESPTLDNQKSSSLGLIELATEYAKQGVWYDTLNILVTAQLAQPHDATLVDEWQELLEQVGLDAIASQPISEQL
ncbi:MAG: DUF928 domain-containing protein [Symploca sp. SIO2E6]|nr:DUF928 domain-containing protein [Symploca sp. SIO2E6]